MNLRHDISQNYELKAAIQALFGNQTWLDLKETTSLATWRRYVMKLLDAIELSIDCSVEIRDDAWAAEVAGNLARGRKSAKSSKSIEALLSGFNATLLGQVFLQIGFLPKRDTARKAVALTKANWRMNNWRSVQYVQSPAQIEAMFWSEQQGKIGFERQMPPHEEHRINKSKLPCSR